MKDERYSTEDCNTGDWNTGDWNTGDWNTGDCNTGDCNTGDWNTVNNETGFFNTIQSPTIRVFNKDCDLAEWEKSIKPSFLYFKLTKWISSDEMTNQEKEDHPIHKTTGGYFKKYDYKEAFQKSYNQASQEEKELLLKLPNFDADVFLEISGIDVRNPNNYEQISELESNISEMEKQLEELKEKLNKMK